MENKPSINNIVKLIAQLSIDKSSQLFSKFIKSGAAIELERAHVVDITNATAEVAAQEMNVVGVFIDLIGDAPFKFLFYVEEKDSMAMADMILRLEEGTTKELDTMALSAVQEVGNILASVISNVFASDFQIDMKPSPPTVMQDYAGTLFSEFIMGNASELDDILIVECRFRLIARDISCSMYILPLPGSDKILSYLASTM